jgi:hypothetical protein
MADETQTQTNESENKVGKTQGDNENKQKSQAEQTTENAEKSGDGVKQESSDNKEVDFYKEELKKANEIINHKNRAIESMKKEPKLDAEILTETIQKMVNEKVDGIEEKFKSIIFEKEIKDGINKVASSEDEAKLIELHFETVKNSPLYKTNEEKIKAAKLLANQQLIYNEGIKEGMEKKREDIMKSFSASKASSEGADYYDENDPAVQFVKAINPKALKFLKK